MCIFENLPTICTTRKCTNEIRYWLWEYDFYVTCAVVEEHVVLLLIGITIFNASDQMLPHFNFCSLRDEETFFPFETLWRDGTYGRYDGHSIENYLAGWIVIISGSSNLLTLAYTQDNSTMA